MLNTIKLQSALSAPIKIVDNLIKILHLANFALYLYENMMLSIPFGQILIANISKVFIYTFLQFSVLRLKIAAFFATILAKQACLYLYIFSFFLSTNLAVQISIFFAIIIVF